MADRISEIKSLLDILSSQLVAELESQREEIQLLKEKIAVLEEDASERPVVTAPVQQTVATEETFAEEPDTDTVVPSSPAERRQVSSVFGGFTPEPEESYFTVTDLNEVHSAPKTTVSDLFAERNTIADVAQSKNPTWMVDIPGPRVEMIQSALTFNDRLTFIRELFEGDSEQFNITLDRINETSTFEEVVSDMRDAYPEWDENSPLVYRFYMEVRRRFRD